MNGTPQTDLHAGVAAAFKEAREMSGLSQRELASTLGTSSRAIQEIEADDRALFTNYSPAEVKLIAGALGVAPEWLLNCDCGEPALGGAELLELLRKGAQANPVALEEFERGVGWRVAPLLESPDRLLAEVTVEALRGLLAALGIDWRRAIAGL
jgi:transcriptional regulator with XRE-family HTH domain